MEPTKHRAASFKTTVFRGRGTAFLVLAALLTCVARTSVAEEKPTAASILDKQIEALGGRDAMAKIENRVMEGEIKIPAMGMTGQIKNYQDSKSNMRVKVELPGIGVEESGFDGKVAWDNSMMTGTRIKEGEELASVKRDSKLFPDLHWKELYKNAELVGSETIGEHDCWKIELTPEVGSKRVLWIDKKEHLTRRVKSTEASAMGKIDAEATMSDYREVDGLKYPFVITQVIGGGMQTITFEVKSVKHNQKLPSDTFATPEAVKAMLPAEEKAGS